MYKSELELGMKTFTISLDKDQYSVGQTVNGNLSVKINKTIQLRDLIFLVRGTESVKFYIAMGHHSIKYSNSDCFFKQDLTPFVITAGARIKKDKKLEIPAHIQNIPFNFVIPNDVLESYNGKRVGMTYEIIFRADRSWRRDVDEKLEFCVISGHKLGSVHNQGLIEEEMTQSGVYANMCLERNTFSPGEILKGTLTIENFGGKEIRKATLKLLGIEWGIGISEQKIGLKHRKNEEREISNTIETHSKDIEFNNDGTIAFEFATPAKAKKSYKGKFTEYFWTLGVKMDIKLEPDLYIRTRLICG